jgi:nucleotide-binding universal stress UspA family protein
MGTHGRGLFGRLLIGSVTHSLLSKTPVPFLTVCRGTGSRAPERILFATDFGAATEAAFEYTLELARTAQSKVVAFHAIVPPMIGPGARMPAALTEETREALRAKLHGYAETGKRLQVPVETAMAESVTAASAILACAVSTGSDLIVVGIDEKNLIERTLLGSTAEHVIREAHIPVLSLPAKAPQSA